MLAYSLYKKGIREAREAGRPAPTAESRSPSDAERRAFRSLATEMLDRFGASAQESARESILDGGLRPDLDNLKTDVLAHIDRRTSWKSAFLVNILAWIASIGVTVLIAIGVSAPTWAPQLRTMLGLG